MSISKIIYRCALLSSMFIMSGFCYSSEIITLRVTHAPPHYFKNASGQWTGSGIETVKAVIIEAGYKPKYLNVPWMRALMLLEQGKLDMMMGLSITQERSRFLHWIGPVRNEEMTLVVRKENINFNIKSLDDLAAIADDLSKPFGLQLGAYYGEGFSLKLQQAQFRGKFYTSTTLKQNLGLTNSGRILGFFENKASIDHRISNDPEYKQLVLHPFVLNNSPVYYGLSKKTSVDFYQKLQQAFDKLEKNGTLDNLRNKR